MLELVLEVDDGQVAQPAALVDVDGRVAPEVSARDGDALGGQVDQCLSYKARADSCLESLAAGSKSEETRTVKEAARPDSKVSA